jgi:polyferredoxin
MKGKRHISYPAVSREQTREFGMLTVVVMSFLAFYLRQSNFSVVIFILALLTLLFPLIFYPFAWLWFGLSKVMGKISTGLLLGVVFCIAVIPVGLIRKILGLDGLKLKQFKKTTDTVLLTREHIYVDSDLMHTF